MKISRKYYPIIIGTILSIALNIWIWIVRDSSDTPINLVAFILIWFDLILAWLTFRRRQDIAHLFLAVGLIIAVLVLLNVYWVPTRGM